MVAAQEPKPLDPASERSAPPPWAPLDTALLSALAILFILVVFRQVQWNITPIEDASMLLRYAQNFASGYGIRWNIHQPPVDGATDFLYTVAIGTLARITHISVVTASRLLNLAAHISSVLLIFLGSRRLLGANRWLAFAAAAYLIAGPAIGMTNGCFGAPFFAFFLLACWCAGLRYAFVRPSWPTAISMSSLGLLAGLTRPEGVLIAIMLLFATLYLTLTRIPRSEPDRAWKQCVPLFLSFTLIFAVCGGAYFAWRWKYFGYPLPNPFYIKGNGHIYISSLRYSTINLLHVLYPALPLLPLGWLSLRTRRLAQALTALLLMFDLMWLLLINTNNHYGRFQYAIVPLTLMTLAALGSEASLLFTGSRNTKPYNNFPRWILPAAGTLALASSMLYVSQLYGSTDVAWGMRAFATRLQPLAARGYTMAVTEAGALPLYSQWQTIDGLGLNDAYIAHHHQHLSTEYLDQFHPEVIMVHIDTELHEQFVQNGIGSPPVTGSGGWNQEFMNFYAKNHGYTLAAIWGSDQCNLHIYWVRPGFPDYATVLSDIRDHPYYFLDNGFLAHDYRNQLDSLQNCALPAGPA